MVAADSEWSGAIFECFHLQFQDMICWIYHLVDTVHHLYEADLRGWERDDNGRPRTQVLKL